MKTMLVAVVLVGLAIAPSWADGPSVTVQNQENWRFWYLLDPPGFAEEEPGSPWLTMKASTLMAREGEAFPFSVLEPGQTTTFTGLSEGTHYLLGFFESDSLDEFPVRLITLQADNAMGVRHYDVYSVPEIMMAARGKGMLAQFARAAEEVATAEETVEETAEETEGEAPAEEAVAEAPAVEEPAAAEAMEEAAVEESVVEEVAAEAPPAEAAVEEPVVEEVAAEAPPAEEAVEEAAAEVAGPEVLAAFADTYDPVYFTRESRDGLVVLPIASSRSWGRPGTRLSEFSGALTDGMVTLVLRSTGGFAENVSCFFYVFPMRTAGGASEYTFEARPQIGGRAAVVLWQKGRELPRLIGSAQTVGEAFTWTASANELPADLARSLGPTTTLDLTTAWLDQTSGTWEEFYFTTFAVADLMR